MRPSQLIGANVKMSLEVPLKRDTHVAHDLPRRTHLVFVQRSLPFGRHDGQRAGLETEQTPEELSANIQTGRQKRRGSRAVTHHIVEFAQSVLSIELF